MIEKIMWKKNKKLKVVSLFSGCWGLDLWFINAWYEVVWSNDFFPEAVESYKKNIWDHIVLWDITKIASNEIPDDFDILLWWFPCQWFSIANIKRSMKDERNFLYKEMSSLVEKFSMISESLKWFLPIGSLMANLVLPGSPREYHLP